MTKEYYEFLFKMRSSGLVHNTPAFLAKCTAVSYFGWNEYQLTTDSDGNLALGDGKNGEVGELSANYRKNMRNSIISTASILPIIADAENINFEEALTLTDYYISHADDIKTFAEYNERMTALFLDFQKLIENSRRKSYGIIVDNIIDYINQNLYGKLKLSDIAQHTGYTPAYLSELFYKKTGRHIQEYILDRKTEEVKRLLLYSDRSCTEIAGALGYSSLSHLSSSFKARTGINLREFKKSSRGTYQHKET